MITVETGTCVVGANSYSTLEEFKTFLNAMLLNEANYTDAQLEALLISGHVALHLKYAPALQYKQGYRFRFYLMLHNF